MWPTECVELKHIDKLLQCGICYEYMDTSVITSCSHNYCSLCIRKYLHYKTQCPVCAEETFEKDLRKNQLLDDIIIHYLNFKEKYNKKFYNEEVLIRKNNNLKIECSANNYENNIEQDVPNTVETYQSFDSPTLAANNTTPRRRKDYQQDISTPSTSADLKIPLMFTPKSKKNFQKEENYQIVTCPVCKVNISENNINKHLDDCLKRENTKNQPKISEPKRKPLPKLVLSLLKDNALRKKVKELGLSSQGDRKALENRLQRYTVLYNAECDRTCPRAISELIKQCEEEENLEKKAQKQSSNRLNVNRNTEHNIIEQQRQKYLAANKDSFNQLIAQIKHDTGMQKVSVRRNILNRKRSDTFNNHVVKKESSIKDSPKTNFLPLNSADYIEDSNSNTSCPLQMYSSENPINFLNIELASSSNDSTDHCNYDNCLPNSEVRPDSFNAIIKMENIKVDTSSPENKVHEEITFNNQSRQIDLDIKRSASNAIKINAENEEQFVLSKKNKNDAKYNSNEYVAYSEPKDKGQEESNKDIDLIIDVENFIEDSNINIQENHGRLKQLNKSIEQDTGSIKFEKENMLDKDLSTFRKRELALNDDEKMTDRTINAKKSLRLGLSEAKAFNNENLSEAVRDEEKSQSEKEHSQVIRTNNIRNFTRKSNRLRNKISNKKSNNIS